MEVFLGLGVGASTDFCMAPVMANLVSPVTGIVNITIATASNPVLTSSPRDIRQTKRVVARKQKSQIPSRADPSEKPNPESRYESGKYKKIRIKSKDSKGNTLVLELEINLRFVNLNSDNQTQKVLSRKITYNK